MYIALLRAVNVGGQHKIKMADLRRVLAAQGLQDPKTYIQSGNILFNSNDTEESLQKLVENTIEEHFGFPIDVILRNVAELDEMLAHCPYVRQDNESSTANLHVALLKNPPPPEATAQLGKYTSPYERFQIIGRDIYLLLEQGMRNSKLAPQIHKLGTTATVRNWKTLTKLRTMAHETKE